MEIEHRFHEAFLARHEPPSEVDKIELPAVDGKMVTINTDEATDCALAYRDAVILEKDAKELRKMAEARIKTLMGEATIAELPGLRCYNQMYPGRETLDKKALVADGIDVSKYQKVGKPYPVFRAFRLGR
jgi:hypothetical protein